MFSGLFERVDNSNLIIFRIFFGLLMTIECWGALYTGWVTGTFVEPSGTFNFIGFDFLQSFVGSQMYVIYFVMGALGIFIMLGFMYKAATIGFFLLWGITYLAQKSHYNNHYYLIWLVSFYMIIVPANISTSIDAQLNPKIKSNSTPRWTYLLFIIQVSIVYFFAALAKLYPGWISGDFLLLRLGQSANWYQNVLGLDIIAELLRSKDLAIVLSYAGILFDFLIVPLLLFKPTRRIAFFGAVMFHIFNSITLHIGIFPYFALALCVFFFPTKSFKKIFFPFRARAMSDDAMYLKKSKKNLILGFMVFFICLQVYLPMRHWFIPESVLWTEEGHRLSWRMMLRAKNGYATFMVQDGENGKRQRVNVRKHLVSAQIGDVYSKPDMMWQFAQKLAKYYKKEGMQNPKIYVQDSWIMVNNGQKHPFVKENVDLASQKWSYFGHQSWIEPQPDSKELDAFLW